MDISATIQLVITQGENQNAEFKTSFGDEVIISLVAFANAKGGKVYVGVNDKGKVTGVTPGKETVQQWINEIKTKTEPSLIPDAETVNSSWDYYPRPEKTTADLSFEKVQRAIDIITRRIHDNSNGTFRLRNSH